MTSRSATATVLLLGTSACSGADPYADKFTNVDTAWAVTDDEGYEWAIVKDTTHPTPILRAAKLPHASDGSMGRHLRVRGALGRCSAG